MGNILTPLTLRVWLLIFICVGYKKPNWRLEIEGVVFLINTVGSDTAIEERVQVVVLAVRNGKEVFGLVPKTFREAGVDRKVETL